MDKDPHPHATGPTKWRADHCESHHYACDCREWEFATRVAEFERDAERYRWLRDHWHNLCTATGIDTHGNYCVTEVFVGAGEHAPFADGTLDAAIDAAMREQGANT